MRRPGATPVDHGDVLTCVSITSSGVVRKEVAGNQSKDFHASVGSRDFHVISTEYLITLRETYALE